MTGKILKNKTYEEIYGIEKAKKLKEIRSKNWKGRKHSIKSIKKMSKIKLGKKFTKTHKKNLSLNHRKYQSIEAKRKARISMIKHIKQFRGSFSSNIGKNEKQILDELELSLDYKILRQYFIIGYFIDGYIPELNLAIEVDEKYHNKKIKKDKEREKNIKKELGCKFLRINNYD